MRINHNIAALNTHRQLNSAAGAQSKSMEKLASGLRINRAGDDAAGLAISEKMRAQVRGLDQAAKNSQDGISMIQTAEGALNETHDILQRMRELATQAANDTNVGVDRGEIQKEINQLSSEINRVGNTTEFNTQSLLKGDGKANLALTGVGSVAGSMGSGVTGSTTHTQATQTLTAATKTAADLNGKNLTVTLNGQALKINFVTDAALTGSDNISVDTANVTSNEITVKVKGNLATADGEQALAGAIRDGLTAIIGKNDVLKGNYEITGATDKIIMTATTTANGGKLDGDKGNIAATAANADVITGGAAASVGTTTHVAATKDIAFAGKTGADLIGKGFTIDGKQYEFYDANAGAYKGNAEGINISATATASDIATAVAGQVKGDGFTVAVNGGVNTTVTFSATKLGAEGNNSVQFTDGGVQKNFEAIFQVGANKGQSMTISIEDMRSSALGITGKAGDAGFTTQNVVTDGTNNSVKESALDVSNHTNASSAIKVINDAIEKVSAQRSNLGAFQNRLEHTINNLGTSSENLTAAESRIRDVDMAKEMMNQTKNSILAQAAQAMLAQANQQPQGVLQLLR